MKLNKFKSGMQIVIMAHHRQKETIRAVAAIKKVDFGCKTEIVVSDNATTPEFVIKDLPSDVIHKIRIPSGDSLWHANEILQEVDHEWTLLTHDDDEMLPALGEVFKRFYDDPEVMMITGRSQIVVNGVNTIDQGYFNRLKAAKLFESLTEPRSDLYECLFDIGSLFPASAMIVRTTHLKKIAHINSDYDLAGDLAHSMGISYNAKVVFEGNIDVMRYHIHGANSVFSPQAAGGLMADFTIVRLNEAVIRDIEITRDRKLMLTKSILISRLLARAFHLNARDQNIKLYTRKFNATHPNKRISRMLLIPIPLGPVKILIRRLMWKRLGVNRWGY